MKGLTKRQSEIVEFIRSFTQENGYSPSFRDIMARFEFASLSTVSDHVKALKKKGLITYQKRSSRSIALTKPSFEQGSNTCTLSFIGSISLGEAFVLFPGIKSVTLPSQLVPHPEKSYVIKAKGGALKEELMEEGDLLVIETQEDVEQGETVLASIDGLPFIRKIFFKEGHVELKSCNPTIDPIIINQSLVQIQGCLIALIRVY